MTLTDGLVLGVIYLEKQLLLEFNRDESIIRMPGSPTGKIPLTSVSSSFVGNVPVSALALVMLTWFVGNVLTTRAGLSPKVGIKFV